MKEKDNLKSGPPSSGFSGKLSNVIYSQSFSFGVFLIPVLDMRVIGSWSDASKAAELASAMMDSGVDVFTAIAGGAAQGLIKTASERGAYIVWYNTNAYNTAAVIAGCGIMEQKKLIMEVLNDALEDKIQYGISQTLGVRDGYLGFISDDPQYFNLVPADIREKFEIFLNGFIND